MALELSSHSIGYNSAAVPHPRLMPASSEADGGGNSSASRCPWCRKKGRLLIWSIFY